jgi:hypothetical protein
MRAKHFLVTASLLLGMIAATCQSWRLGGIGGAAARAQEARAEAVSGSLVVKVAFAPADVKVRPEAGFDFVELSGGTMPEDQPGDFWLPAKYVNVLVPAGAKVTGIVPKAIDEQVIAKGLKVYPVQPPVPLSKPKGAFVKHKDRILLGREKIPAALAVQGGTHRMRGFTFVSVRVNPVRYVPSTGELFLAKAMELTVTYDLPGERPKAAGRNLKHFSDAVRRMVVNPQQLDTDARFAPVDSAQVRPAGGAAPLAVCDYLIITSDDAALQTAFQALATHRQGFNGFTTAVVSTATIYATYSGTDNQAKIRNCIKDYVNTKGTLYVVLGGDNTVVPVRACYVTCGGETETAMPTDLYYAGLDGTWDDTNSNGVYGEAGSPSEGDLAYDVIVGRIPVQSAAQATAYIDKVIDYDNSPGSYSALANKFFLGGNKAWDNYTGSNRPSDTCSDGLSQFNAHSPVSDVEIWNRRIHRDYVQAAGWDESGRKGFFDTVTSWDGGTAGDYSLDATNLAAALGEEWNLVTFFTHGNTQIWGLESGYFTSTNAAALSGKTLFVYTQACLTGAFDTAEPSLSEAFLRNASGGALVYLGCSRYGWGSPGSYYGGPSSAYAAEFMRQLFTVGKQITGEAFFEHKATFAGSSGSNGAYRWIMFGLNFQGDPALHFLSPGGSKPDLVIQSISHEPATVLPGDTVTFTVTVRNQGTAAAGSFSTGFWSDRSAAPAIGDAPDGSQTTGSLAAGATATLTFTATAGSAGTCKAWAYADRNGGASEVTESNEGNNAGPAGGHAWTVTPADAPDLVIQSIGHSPATVVPGVTVTFTVTVKNQGATAAGLFATGFWSHRATAPGISSAPEGQQDISSLAAGATTTLTFTVTAGPAGNYTAWAYADRYGGASEVSETHEDNNAGPAGGYAWTVNAGSNQAPVIGSPAWANPDAITLPTNTTQVHVVASDPDSGPQALTYTWTKVSGSGTVSFSPNGTAGACDTTATFSAAGSYVLRVTVSDAADQVTSDTSTITVNSAPSNDNFADRITLSGSSASTTGSNAGYTKEVGEPSHAGDSGGASAWWTWTAGSAGTLTISTSGSDFDTLLAVYTGSSVSGLTEVASNDDYVGLTSRVSFSVTSGTTYQIAVDGYSGATGNIALSLSFVAASPPPAPTIPPSGGHHGGGGGGGCSLTAGTGSASGALGWAAPYASLGLVWLLARRRKARHGKPQIVD